VGAISDVEQSLSPPASPNRRKFLADAVMAAGALLGLGGMAFRFAQYLYPVILPEKVVEVSAGKLAEIPEGGVRYVNLPEGPVMLENTGGTGVRAFSAICTHLGCIVQWQKDTKEFVCPCHGGKYDFDGKVTYGPPPRPLDPIEVKVQSGEVFVMMKSRKEEKV
jgi:cytochrome b6-f complex iron-sulfur subunit